MEMNGTNISVSTFAMKKAMGMPNILMNLVQSFVMNGNQTLGAKASIPQAVDVSVVFGKDKIIDLVV